MRIIVVLPAPFSPSSANTVPGAIARSTSSSASQRRKRIVNDSVVITGSMVTLDSGCGKKLGGSSRSRLRRSTGVLAVALRFGLGRFAGQHRRLGFAKTFQVLLDEALDLAFGKSRVPGFRQDLADPLVDHRGTLRLAEFHGLIADHHAATAETFDHAVGLQLLKRSGDRVGVEGDWV